MDGMSESDNASIGENGIGGKVTSCALIILQDLYMNTLHAGKTLVSEYFTVTLQSHKRKCPSNVSQKES